MPLTAEGKLFPYPQLNLSIPSIRLIHLERTSQGDIIGQLKTSSVSNVKNGYRAVSYVWGEKTYSNNIIINGHPFPILDNLYRILEVICDDRILCQSWWWIDSICINQGDGLQIEMERNTQVAMMKDIYEHAKMVLGWLGPASTQNQEAIAFLYVLKKHRNRLDAQKDDKERRLPAELQHRTNWKAIEVLFLNEWWRRVWTLQEYIVPTRFTFYCGNSNISREDMKVALYAIRLALNFDRSLMSWMAYVRAWNRRRLYMWHRDGLPITLLGLIAFVGNYKSSNPRDRIYSVLGMVKDADLAGRPRYGNDVEEVYTDLVRNFAEKHNSLDIICLADRFNWDMVEGHDHLKLPSWCPDWRAKDPSWVIPAMVCQSSGKIGNFMPTRLVPDKGETAARYAAGTCEGPLRFEFSVDQRMSCRGVFIDGVDGIGGLRVMTYAGDGETDREEMYDYVQSGSEESVLWPGQTKATTTSTILTGLARCLMLDRRDRYLTQGLLSGLCHKHLRDLCLATLQAPEQVDPSFVDWFERNRNLRVQGHSFEDVCMWSVDLDVEYDGGIPNQEAFLSRFMDTTKHMSRRLMTTNEGYTGMVPCRTQKGDQIWVLQGCSVPVLLRKREKDDEFDFVGECYLDGFMNGEAFQLLNRTERRRMQHIKLA